MFSTQSISLCSRLSKRTDDIAGEPMGFDPVSIITLVLSMIPQVMKLWAECHQQPPTPGPVPPVLAASGITAETWKQACGAKFAAEQSVSGDGFSDFAVRQATVQIRKAKHIRKKAARPLAISALELARDESVESIATSLQNAKSNASSLGL